MVKSLINNLVSVQFVKYVCVGFLGTGLDFLFLYLLVEYGQIYYLLAALMSVSVVLWVSFSLNKYWTFRDFGKNYFPQFGKYILSHLVALGVSLLILATLVEIFNFWYLFAKVFATVGAAITNFLIVKKFIFKEERPVVKENV